MAFGGSGGSSRVKSDINVTPLVDIVLVMLIIFLVAMPVVMRDITIDIPKKLEDPPPDVVQQDQMIVEVRKEGLDGQGKILTITLNGVDVSRTEIAQKLRDRLEHRMEKVVFVDFANETRYGDAVQLMDLVKGAGATTVGMKIKEEAGATPPGGAPAQSAPAHP